MSKFLLGKKLGMSEWWNDKKEVEPITLVDCRGLLVVGKKTREKDGYDAICLGTAKKKYQESEDMNKLVLKRSNFAAVKEFPISPPTGETRPSGGQPEDFKKGEGEKIEVDVFDPGDKVSVTAISKGKGFQGVIKRHGFAGGPKTHGHRHVLRSGGSIGSAFPQHVQKGKKMAGRMGGSQVTVKNLKIAWTDKDKAVVAIKGAIPGRKGSWVKIVQN